MRIGITGISGSLGSALAASLAPHHTVVGVTRDELKAEAVMAQHAATGAVRCMVLAAGLADRDGLTKAFDGCKAIIHAAALKRIGGSVYATDELVKTNVVGTMHVIQAARAVGVERLVLVSSDKAVEATNLYGATKFCAECVAVQANAFCFPKGLAVSVVRYGNVLGSRGSVVHLWREQARAGQPLTLTDETMTRFIITMEEAVAVVRDALALMEGGEIFVPLLCGAKMIDLARAVLAEAGRDGEAQLVGRRPGGEKLHESLLSQEELARTFPCGRNLLSVLPSHRTWSDRAYPTIGSAVVAPYRSDLVPQLDAEKLLDLLRGVGYRSSTQ